MPQGLDEGFTLLDSVVEFLAMIEVIGKGGMDIRQGQIVFGGDFIRVHAQPFVPEHDVLNRNAAPGDMRFPPPPLPAISRYAGLLFSQSWLISFSSRKNPGNVLYAIFLINFLSSSSS